MSPARLDYTPLYEVLATLPAIKSWGEMLPVQVEKALASSRHGDMERWLDALEALPERRRPSRIELNAGCVTVGGPEDISSEEREELASRLKAFHPWRKGPYCLHGIHIDTEWRSDWKWDRLADHIDSLKGQRVLDVGCGNGYHCWRMAGAGAELIVGIDPTLVSVMQFHAVRHLIGPASVFVLPLRLQELPVGLEAFDTVFSMGVIYHQRDPQVHLAHLHSCLRPGGQLALESLVVEGKNRVLKPSGRYARMPNVHALPSADVLMQWVEQAGFAHPRLVDVTPTTVEEQRSTEWMRFESLAACLDPNDNSRTIEGLPAPVRAIVVAEKP